MTARSPTWKIPDRGLSLQDIQWVDLWQDGGVDRLVRSIKNALQVPDHAPRGPTEAAALRLGVGPDQAPLHLVLSEMPAYKTKFITSKSIEDMQTLLY
jgi:hypothetical protein